MLTCACRCDYCFFEIVAVTIFPFVDRTYMGLGFLFPIEDVKIYLSLARGDEQRILPFAILRPKS